MSNKVYNYFEKDYRYLISYLEFIDNNIYTNPHSVIIKGRILCENISKEIGKIEDIGMLNDLTQLERLKVLEESGVLNFKDDIDIAFHTVRKIGNKAAHDDIGEDIGLALVVHKSIYTIISWFIQSYIDYEFDEPYKNPQPKVDQQHIDTKIIEDITRKALDDYFKKNKIIEDIDEKDSDIEDAYIEMTVENIFDDVEDKGCLEQQLSRLKQSSKEAVENLGEFTPFKKYMHIIREAQENFEELIVQASKSNKSELILVCGSVGDGKSHIISYYNNSKDYKDIIKEFTLHNDATESLEPDKTSMDTLNILLDDFSDEKINVSIKKIILAINLGTLNNFIDSEYGSRFTKLKQYVEDKKILENSIGDSTYDSKSNFQYVNFSDYHVFTLKDGKVNSKFIKELIQRVTRSFNIDEHENNIFFTSYKKNCCKCSNKDCCPIKLNYELLSNESVQNSIIDLLVQCMIKNKIIISTRSLLNLIYEIIVPISYIDVNSPTLKSNISKMNYEDYIRSLLPNVIFEHRELSYIFDSLSTLDPLNIRNKQVDNFIIDFNNNYDFIKYFDNNLEYSSSFLGKVASLNLSERIDGDKLRYLLLKLFIRSFYLCGTSNLFELRDRDYDNYIQALFYWNKGEKVKLKEFYSNIRMGILKWNGEADKNSINIFLGKNQTNYKVSEKISLKADTGNLPTNTDNELIKFFSTVTVIFKGNGEDNEYKIEVDYPLYKLLTRINNGYRPNKKDKNQFINFVDFINKVEEAGSQNEELIFSEKNTENNRQFKLEYDEEFETYKFMEI